MTMARIGKGLLALGALVFCGAVAWWYLFYEQVLGENVQMARDCFYHTTDTCAVGNLVLEYTGNIPPYDPMVLWVAGILAVVGVLVLSAATPPAKK